MNIKDNKLKRPPERPVFNRENTRFISLSEMQKIDPSLKPKKIKTFNRWWTPAVAIVLSASITAGAFKLQSGSSQKAALIEEENSETYMIEIKNFTPPAPQNQQTASLVENSNSKDVGVPVERQPADFDEEEFMKETYFQKSDSSELGAETEH